MWLYIALALVAFLYYMYISLKFDHWEKKGIPTASGNELFFGHFKPFIMVKKHLNEIYENMYREFPDAPLVGYYIMNIPALLIKDLEIVKTVLISEFSSFNFNGFTIDKDVDKLTANNPFVLKGDEWKSARAQVTPALSLTKLKGYLPNMFKVGDEMVKCIKKNCNGPLELEARELCVKYSTDVIGNAIYGIENNSFVNKDTLMALVTNELNMESSVFDNIKMFLERLPIINKFFPASLFQVSPRKVLTLTDEMRALALMIEAARRLGEGGLAIIFASEKLQDVMVALTRKIVKERLATGEKRNDLIQLLLAQKENDTQGVYTDVYMSGQVFILIFDMYETSSNVLALILYVLGKHPDVQEKLRAEIREIKSRNNGDFTVEDIEGAKYLDMVYNESFRNFSFALNRECTSDCVVPVPGSDPLRITKGTPIVIPVGAIHKDPKYYPDPEKFDPERFTEEEVAKRPRLAFMPFGDGPKKCIGARMVTLHIKAAIIKILDNFKLTPSPKTIYPFQIDSRYTFTFRPKGGSWVIFEPIC